MKRLIQLFFITTFLFSPSLLAVSLQQVFKASPKLANFKPSPLALHCSDEEAMVRVDNKVYELRYITYSDVDGKALTRTLQQLARDYNFMNQEGRPYEVNPIVTTTTWIASDQLKEDGIYYTISIKEIGEQTKVNAKN